MDLLGTGPQNPLGPGNALRTDQFIELQKDEDKGTVAKEEEAARDRYEDISQTEMLLERQAENMRRLVDESPTDQNKQNYKDALAQLEAARGDQSSAMADMFKYQDPRMQKAKKYEKLGLDFSRDEAGMPQFDFQKIGRNRRSVSSLL